MNINVIIFSIFVLFLIVFCVWIVFPLFLEQPEYKVLKSEDKFQIRFYEEFTIAKVKTSGNQNDALKKGFVPLARYIGAKNRYGEKIKMTVPVMQTKIQSGTDWNVFFSMPSKYSVDSLPKPKNSVIQFEKIPPRYVAVIRFNGVASEAILESKQNILIEWINKMNFQITGDSFYLFYNDPITPGFFRKNEVAIIVSGFKPG